MTSTAANAPNQPDEAAMTGPSTTNQVNAAVYGIQVASVTGNVTYSTTGPARTFLIALWLTDAEISDLKEQFVHPAEFNQAIRALRDNYVVVLCGSGTGRTFTGRKLLLEHGHTRIAQLNPGRSLDTIEAQELTQGAGYLWEANEVDSTAFSVNAFEVAAHAIRSAGSRLVIVVDHPSRVPREISGHAVRLTPPNALSVAHAVIRRQNGAMREKAAEVLNGDLARALNEDDPPYKAVRAACLAIGVANNELGTARALADLNEDIDQTIATVYEGWSVLEFSMLLAVAILENRPFDEVANLAQRLDKLIRTAELPPDSKLAPREIFKYPKAELLRLIRAKTMLRDHSTHPGLQEETVRFIRQDWAEAAICHVWRQFLPVQPLLLDWMCTGHMLYHHASASVAAICLVIKRIPAHDPLGIVDRLAGRNTFDHRKLAAWILVRLANVHDHQPLVDQALATWVDGESANRKATAVMTFALRYSKNDPRQALDQIAAVCRTTESSRVRWTAFHSVLFMLQDAPEHRAIVFGAVRIWVNTPKRRAHVDGPRLVGLHVGLWVAGFYPNVQKRYVDAAELAVQHADDIGFLTNKILRDHDLGPGAFDLLADLATTAGYDNMIGTDPAPDSAGQELVRILTLVTPDLRWWHRRKTVASLCHRHPTRRRQIRLVFSAARRHQRRHPVPTSPTGG